jgi:shikimate kinase
MRRHIILVGLAGSGKSTVGRLVAETLQAPLIDIDTLLMREMGMPVARIFAMHGETIFRRMERDAVRTARNSPPAVLVPGGGWAAQEGEVEAAWQSSLIIYLKCMAMTAAKRAGQSEDRPLLMEEDPVAKMRTLLAAREPYYSQAHCQIGTDVKPAAAVAEEVVRLAREKGGW